MKNQPLNRPYIRPLPPSWWMQEKRYVRYMLREVTCLFLAVQALVFLVGVYRLSQGREAFEAFLAALWSPVGLLFSAVLLLMAVVHSVTWFNLTPKAMPIWVGEEKQPGWIIVAAHYGAWIIGSVIVLFAVGGM